MEIPNIIKRNLEAGNVFKIVIIGQGYNPIQGRSGEYRSFGLTVVNYEGKKYPAFANSNLWYFSPN